MAKCLLSKIKSTLFIYLFFKNIFLICNIGILVQILAMIEEAAGTRMYECKKISAQKTIEKKDAKLKEIQTVCLCFFRSSCRVCVCLELCFICPFVFATL